MMDVYMILALAATFGVFLLFFHWCGQVVEEGGKDQ